MSDKNSSSEPSMEQILASIAEIISDDGEEATPVQVASAPAVEEIPHVPHSAQAQLPVMAEQGVYYNESPMDYAPQPVHLASAPEPIYTVQPVSGSLTDRLANMEQAAPTDAQTAQAQAGDAQPLQMRPVYEDGPAAPPGFMTPDMQNNNAAAPMALNMQVPQMMGQPGDIENQGFPVESAEDFLANNAQRAALASQAPPAPVIPQPQDVSPQSAPEMNAPQPQMAGGVNSAPRPPEFSVNPALMAQEPLTAAQTPAIQNAPPVMEQAQEVVPEMVNAPGFVAPEVMAEPQAQPTVNPVQAELPQNLPPVAPEHTEQSAPVTPSVTADVLNSFKVAEEEAMVAAPLEEVAPVAPEILGMEETLSTGLPSSEAVAPGQGGLLDASFIPATDHTAPAPLTAEPVSLQSEPVAVTPMPLTSSPAPAPNAVPEANAGQEPVAEAVMSPDVTAPDVAAEQAVPEKAEPAAEMTDGTEAGEEGDVSDGLNGAIHQMVQPMIKQWLDENLSRVVEDVVRQELASALTKK